MLSCFRHILAQPSIAIDLGTANTRIYAGQGEDFCEEPSLVHHLRQDQEIQPPDAYLSYLNNKFTSSPLRGGVIVDIHNAVTLLKPLLKRTRTGLRHPVSLACAPTDTTELERKLLAKAVLDAGAAQVAIILTLIETGIKKLPENISCEVVESGICLTGGGSCILGMDRLIGAHTNLEVRIAPDPMHSVINGAIQTLQYWKEKENWWENITWPSIPS